jgi:hypothetical protein
MVSYRLVCRVSGFVQVRLEEAWKSNRSGSDCSWETPYTPGAPERISAGMDADLPGLPRK